MAWQNASGYNRRARVEATMNRWKHRLLATGEAGEGSTCDSTWNAGAGCARTDERRATEVAVAVHALNRMLELGRPSYVRIA